MTGSRNSDDPDLERLAKRTVDLWQDQMSSLARDPAVADAMARWFTLLGPLGAAGFGAPGSGASGQQGKTDDEGTGPPGRATGTAAADDSSGYGGPGVARLSERVAELERRVASLESALDRAGDGDGGGDGPPASAGRRQPRNARRTRKS